MRTSLLFVFLIACTISGWSQQGRFVPFHPAGTATFHQESPLQGPVQGLTKQGYLRGERPAQPAPGAATVLRDRSEYIRCSTTEMEEARRAADPSIPSMAEFEQWMARKVAELSEAGTNQRATYEIPYIFHVVHSGEPVGTGANLAASIVYAQMAQLNADYQRTNADASNTPIVFAAAAGSIDILFKPATEDPLGNPLAEPGINRVDGDDLFGISIWEGSDPTSNTQTTLKPNTIWDPERYMNIWSCDLVGGLLGYAQFPEAGSLPGIGTGNGSANTDGVVVYYGSVGSLSNPGTASPYDLGRSLTHEVGHWLGLRHTWGDGGCGEDDFCDDTPLSGAPNFSESPCTFPGPNSCNSGLGDLSDMFQNYMDYSDDECMNLFTDDQIDRMVVVLDNSVRRNSLLSSTVGDGETACQVWENPSPTSGWIDFNNDFGGAPCDDGGGCPFNEITGFEVWASEAYTVDNFIAGATYTFSMCNGPGAGSWVPEFTIIAPSGAVDAFGAGDGDGCSITWTASEDGTYLIVINESGFCGSGSSNESTDNGFPALTCVSGALSSCDLIDPTCDGGTLATSDSVAICPGNEVTVETNGDELIPAGGEYRWSFQPGVDGAGANETGFTVGGTGTSYTFDAGLNGLLAANSLPDMTGTWIVTGIVENSGNSVCGITPTSRPVNFLQEVDPACEATEPCEAGTLAASDSIAVCATETATVETNGDEVIPAGGEYRWSFLPGVDGTGANGTGFSVEGVGASYTFDAGLNGLLADNTLPDLAGTWIVTGFVVDAAEDICSITPSSRAVNFLGESDPACEATASCEPPADLGVDSLSITSSSAGVFWTAGNAGSEDFDLELVDITGGGSFQGVPTHNTPETSFSFSSLSPENTYDVYVRENCPDAIQSDLIITGIMDGPLSGGLPKLIEFRTLNAIADLSVYGVGSANNGGGTDGQEYTFPAIAVPSGAFLFIALDSASMAQFFGGAYNGFVDGVAAVNGDDAIELFLNGEVVDVFGEITHSGAGDWSYLDGWAYRVAGTGPDGSTFQIGNWTFSGANALDGETSNGTAATPYPIATYSTGGRVPSDWVGPVRFTTLPEEVSVPENDTCGGAILVSCGSVINASTADATNGDAPAECDFTLNTGPGVWYRFTGTGDNVTFSLCGSTFDTRIGVFSGSCGSLVCEEGDDDDCDLQSEVRFNTDLGQDYFIYVTGFQEEAGDFTLTITCDEPSEPPVNDTCAGAIVINCPTGIATTTVDASDATADDAPYCETFESSMGAGVWYTYAGDGQLLSIDVLPYGFDAEIQIYSGVCGDLTCEAAMDDGFSTGDPEAIDSFPTLPGVQYYIYIGSWISSETEIDSFQLTVTCTEPPACPEPIDLAFSDLTDSSATITWSAGGEEALWDIEIVDVTGGGNFTGVPTESGLTDTSYAFTGGTPGNDYEVYVRSDCGEDSSTWAGPLEFQTLSEATANDLCEDAIDIACGQTLSGSTTNATFDDAGICGTSNTSPGVWYLFAGNGDEVTFSLCGTADFDTKLSVYSGECGNLACVDGNDDADGCGLTSEVTVETVPGVSYFVLVHGFSDETGDFDISATCVSPPACPAPTALDVTGITEDSATISWTAGGSETSWALEIVDVTGGGSFTGVPTVTGLTETTYAFSGIPGNTYEVYVIANCETLDSDWTGPETFTLTVTSDDNDLCENAITVTCGQTVSGSTTEATFDDAGTCGTSNTAPGVWYHFEGNGDAVTFSLCGTADYDTKISVFSGACGDLTCVAGNDDFSGCADFTSQLTVTTTPGTDYFVLVHGFSSQTGNFDLSISCQEPEPCQAGVLLFADSLAICPDSTVTIVTDGDSLVPAAGSYGLYFEPGPDGTGALGGEFILFFQNTPFTFDQSLNGLLPGNGFPDFAGTWYVYGAVTADVNDAFNAICDLTDDYMVVTFLEAGVGPCAPPPPAPVNDTCGGAIVLTCPDGLPTTTVNATGATATDAPFCEEAGSSVGAGLWYTVEGNGQLLTVVADPYVFDAEIQIWSGVCGDLSCEQVADAGFDGDAETIADFVTEEGVLYYIYVGSWISSETEIDSFDLTITCADPPTCPEPTDLAATDITQTSATISWTPGGSEISWDLEIVDVTGGGTFTGVPTVTGLTDPTYDFTTGVPGNEYQFWVIANCVEETSEWAGPLTFTTLFVAPANDLCENAIAVTCESSTEGTTLGAAAETGLETCGTSHTTSPGVWYVFTGTGGEVTFSLCNAADYDSKIGVFSGVCGDLTCVGGNDDATGCGLTSEVTVPTSAGVTYYIIVSGFGGSAGDFTLTVTCAEVPECEAPTALTLDDVTETTANVSWTPGDDETLWDIEIVDVTGGGSFTGVPTESGLTSPAYEATGLTPGNTYEVWVRADCDFAASEWTGPLEFTTVVPAPANDLCENAEEVTCGTTVSGTTENATFDDVGFCGTSNTAPGVWYFFAGNGDEVTFSLCNSANFDTKITVFSGACGDLTCEAGNDDGSGCGLTSEVTVETVPGTDYYVLVHGFSSATGDFDLSVTCVTPPPPPANDLCENAEEVTCGSVTEGTTLNATTTGAPGFCGASVTAPGVWYYFAGTDQDVTFSTCNAADFDTKISVYSGSCGDLTCVDGNDDGDGCSGFTSEVEVRTYIGTDYYVYVHGFSGQTGDFTLSVTCADTCEAISVDLESISDVTCFGPGGVDISVVSGTAPFSFLWSDGSTDEDLVVTEAGTYSVTVTGADGCVATAGPFEVGEVPGPGETAPPVVVSPGCSPDGFGSIDVTIGGGTPPYDFLWNTGDTTEDLSGLAAGTYSLAVTDAQGCTYATIDFELTDGTTLIELAPAVITHVDCFGNSTGAIDITVGGGTPPYIYRWSNNQHTEDISGLPAGEYVVYIEDATGCSYLSAIFVVEQPDELVVDGGTVSDAVCNGEASGSVTGIAVSGGTEPYSYEWTNGSTDLDASDLPAGQQQLTVTDANSCTAVSAIFVIGEPTPITVTSVVVTDALCAGDSTGSIDIEVAGGTAPYTYEWSNGATAQDVTGLAAGDYTGTITDASGCVFVSPVITVGEAAPIAVSALTVTDASCNGAEDGAINISVSGGTPPYTYLWSNGSTSQDISGLAAGSYTGTITDANGCTLASPAIEVGEPGALEITLADVTDASCQGASDGAIDIEVSGGTPPYSYLWSNGATTQDLSGLPAGMYTGTITDANGCVLVSPALTVGQPAPLAFSSVTITDNLCNGDAEGAIDIEVTGGTPPYTFSWSNGSTDEDLSGLAAGFYTGTVTDANGCTLVSPALEVEEPFVVFEALPAAVTDVSCNGAEDGSIDITLQGGTLPYSFEWSNGATDEDPTGLTPGEYSFTVTDFNGCVYEFGPIAVGEPAELTVSEVTITDVACAGDATGAIDITVAGGTAPYTFAWSNGATTEDLSGLTAGTYTGTITDANGCTFTSPELTVGGPAEALAASGESTPATSPGVTDGTVTVTVTGGDAPYTFNWNTGDDSQNLTDVAAGTYCVEITDANECTIELCVEVGLGTAVNDIFEIAELVLYPNPAIDVAKLRMSFTAAVNVDLEVTDVLGRALEAVSLRQVTDREVTFDVRNFAAGTYFIRMRVEGRLITLPLVVQH